MTCGGSEGTAQGAGARESLAGRNPRALGLRDGSWSGGGEGSGVFEDKGQGGGMVLFLEEGYLVSSPEGMFLLLQVVLHLLRCKSRDLFQVVH